MHVPKAIPEDPTALAHARIASYQKARQCCMDLAQAAASVAHEAVQADLIDDWEAASILYRKATVLLEQAAEEVTSEQCVPSFICNARFSPQTTDTSVVLQEPTRRCA
eukprot:COSAG02_NODE_558_length_20348_cov_6.479431_17_plen_108_part_00